MRCFKQLFTFLFILSIFVGVLHELDPNHVHDETCEICLISHAPALLSDAVVISSIHTYFEAFYASFVTTSYQAKISLKSRSPPLS